MKSSEIKLYKTPDGKTSFEVKLEKETVWLSQKQAEQLNDLKEAIKILGTTLEYKKLTSDESTGLLKIISDYSYPLKFLTNTIIRY